MRKSELKNVMKLQVEILEQVESEFGTFPEVSLLERDEDRPKSIDFFSYVRWKCMLKYGRNVLCLVD